MKFGIVMKVQIKLNTSFGRFPVYTYENQSNANKRDAASGGIPIAESKMIMVTRDPLGMDGTANDISVTNKLKIKKQLI